MEATLERPALNFTPLIWMIISSITTTLFLFYIDEGYYNLEWMLQKNAWVVFSIFVFCITCIQVILAFLVSLFLSEDATVMASKWIAIAPVTGCVTLGLILAFN